MTSDEYESLVDLCSDDLVRAFKLPKWTKPLTHFPARRFAAEIRDFDDCVEQTGLRSAGQFILDRFTAGVSYSGLESVPSSGPVVLVSNHPGMTDAMAVWTAISRQDIKIIAAERDLLQLLPNMNRHLITIQKDGSTAIREAIKHLKEGGCLLTFPAGRIEPDVTVRPGAAESLDSWSPSVFVLAQRVAGTRVVPVFVKGVISKPATQVPFLRVFKDQKDRDWAAATLQILFRRYRDVRVSVNFGPPVFGDLECLISAMTKLITSEQTVFEDFGL